LDSHLWTEEWKPVVVRTVIIICVCFADKLGLVFSSDLVQCLLTSCFERPINTSSMATVAAPAPGAFDGPSMPTSNKTKGYGATAANGHLAADNAPAGSRSYAAAALPNGKGTTSSSSSTYPSIASRQALFYEGVEQVSCLERQILTRLHMIGALQSLTCGFKLVLAYCPLDEYVLSSNVCNLKHVLSTYICDQCIVQCMHAEGSNAGQQCWLKCV
jgi:hypothetical protein